MTLEEVRLQVTWIRYTHAAKLVRAANAVHRVLESPSGVYAPRSGSESMCVTPDSASSRANSLASRELATDVPTVAWDEPATPVLSVTEAWDSYNDEYDSAA